MSAAATTTAHATASLSPVQRLAHAANFAAHAHRHQKRKGKDALPYVNHVLDVSARLAAVGVDDVNLLIAGLLHDTVEDVGVTREQLVAEFGETVAALVMEVTDDKKLDKVQRKKLQVEHAAHASVPARMLKLADKRSNASDLCGDDGPAHWSPEEKQGYLWWTLAVVRACGNVCSLYGELLELLASQSVTFTTQEALDAELVKYYACIEPSAPKVSTSHKQTTEVAASSVILVHVINDGKVMSYAIPTEAISAVDLVRFQNPANQVAFTWDRVLMFDGEEPFAGIPAWYALAFDLMKRTDFGYRDDSRAVRQLAGDLDASAWRINNPRAIAKRNMLHTVTLFSEERE
jgi:guanosine-3',5'-bis(diphosphate) 3'-pyrophosphohydrolase